MDPSVVVTATGRMRDMRDRLNGAEIPCSRTACVFRRDACHRVPDTLVTLAYGWRSPPCPDPAGGAGGRDRRPATAAGFAVVDVDELPGRDDADLEAGPPPAQPDGPAIVGDHPDAQHGANDRPGGGRRAPQAPGGRPEAEPGSACSALPG